MKPSQLISGVLLCMVIAAGVSCVQNDATPVVTETQVVTEIGQPPSPPAGWPTATLWRTEFASITGAPAATNPCC